MRSPPAARLSGHELGGRPRNYGHLLGLAARYARTWLDGLTVVNRETGWPIGLRWARGLEQAVGPGVPPVLLHAVPALPHMLAEARYLGTFDDGPPRLPARRLHSFAATATVAGRPHEAMLIVREDPLGRLFFDGFLARGSGVAARKDDADPPIPVRRGRTAYPGGRRVEVCRRPTTRLRRGRRASKIPSRIPCRCRRHRMRPPPSRSRASTR